MREFEILSRIRRGILSDEDKQYITTRMAPVRHKDAATLFSTNFDVDTHNRQMLAKLFGRIHLFSAVDSGATQLLGGVPAQRELFLKHGALVMCLKNITAAAGPLVNGSIGRVAAVEVHDHPPGTPRVTVSVNFEDHIGNSFFHTFTVGCNVQDNKFAIEQLGKEVAVRWQLPLKLAYAVTIHKSQGSTLTNVFTDVSGCFEYGQSYTALSRATNLPAMHVRGLQASVVKAHPRAVAFYSAL
jgi:ATP-dependent DNA helicase PIF1